MSGGFVLAIVCSFCAGNVRQIASGGRSNRRRERRGWLRVLLPSGHIASALEGQRARLSTLGLTQVAGLAFRRVTPDAAHGESKFHACTIARISAARSSSLFTAEDGSVSATGRFEA